MSVLWVAFLELNLPIPFIISLIEASKKLNFPTVVMFLIASIL